jgi:hypothetical protein
LDRYADRDEVERAMKSVASVYDLYGKPDRLLFQTPLDIYLITGGMEAEIADFFSLIVNK